MRYTQRENIFTSLILRRLHVPVPGEHVAFEPGGEPGATGGSARCRRQDCALHTGAQPRGERILVSEQSDPRGTVGLLSCALLIVIS